MSKDTPRVDAFTINGSSSRSAHSSNASVSKNLILLRTERIIMKCRSVIFLCFRR